LLNKSATIARRGAAGAALAMPLEQAVQTGETLLDMAGHFSRYGISA
jgi:hypothetical protein